MQGAFLHMTMISRHHAVMSTFALFVIAIIADVANGAPPQRIVGGGNALLGEFPYIVSIQEYEQHECGGAIINSRYVLTAAHCVYDIEPPYGILSVVAGSVWSHRGGQRYEVSEVIVHKGFDISLETSSNDIALLKLKSDIKFNHQTSIINLPKAPTPANVSAVVAGWGATKTDSEFAASCLQKATMKIVDHTTCEEAIEEEIHTEQLCALNGLNIGACQGDSGGPIVVNNEVVGIASYNIPCALGYPDVYTAVYYFVEWINKHVK